MKVYDSIQSVKGPLVIIEGVSGVSYKEIVQITLENGDVVKGQVLAIEKDKVIIQAFESTMGLSTKDVKVKFTGRTAKIGVSSDMLGRIFNGLGEPIDKLPFISEKDVDINGYPLNPTARKTPDEFIQTGISTIDCMMPITRGQKLPIFTLTGMPSNKLAAQIARQAKVKDGKDFAVVFCAMGITESEKAFFIDEFTNTGSLQNTALFLNLARDPTVERIMAPRCALSAAEYLAFEQGKQVLVIMTDMTNYCDALREISSARQEVPGRRGYPGYMYTDLASLYERAGKTFTSKGSITQIPILTMPGDDKTHPVPDLTGYITEGQIVIDRALNKKGYMPPINILGSLSRLKVNKNEVREDAGGLMQQMYAAYATGVELRDLVAVVGKEALSKRDLMYLTFSDEFESKFVNQGFSENRELEETLDLGWELLTIIPKNELKKVKPEHIEKYYPKQ